MSTLNAYVPPALLNQIASLVVAATAAVLLAAAARRKRSSAKARFTAGLVAAAAGHLSLLSYMAVGPWLHRHAGLMNLPVFCGYSLLVLSSYLYGTDTWRKVVDYGEARSVWPRIAVALTAISIVGMSVVYFGTKLCNQAIPDPGSHHGAWSFAAVLLQTTGLLPTHVAAGVYARKHLPGRRMRTARRLLLAYAGAGVLFSLLMISIRFNTPLLRWGKEPMYLTAAVLQFISHASLAVASWSYSEKALGDDD
ncbi:hypothetical protein Srot_2129 [Segniliparus rotundus DSM 44985]|uniref:Uncharacterized protein n=1 Tax=Segniliparus rotundus (strain ATCC BAA-972 / CDC 1076 / CIP 108378 / DSM 44985 / JCM 13578) TaxID=640132 RepID=D6Z9F2_SEGRD|nr:hypothetical protein [Segniliparus rotundus]ADG98582.1 hypothetical protein Srot_2129 [Segniliparus rotundus DSM 44985]